MKRQKLEIKILTIALLFALGLRYVNYSNGTEACNSLRKSMNLQKDHEYEICYTIQTINGSGPGKVYIQQIDEDNPFFYENLYETEMKSSGSFKFTPDKTKVYYIAFIIDWPYGRCFDAEYEMTDLTEQEQQEQAAQEQSIQLFIFTIIITATIMVPLVIVIRLTRREN